MARVRPRRHTTAIRPRHIRSSGRRSPLDSSAGRTPFGVRPSAKPSWRNVATAPRRRRARSAVAIGAAVITLFVMVDTRLDTAREMRGRWGHTTPVLVAERSLSEGVPLTVDDVRVEQWPVGLVFDGTLERLPGKRRLTRSLRSGEPVTAGALVTASSSVAPGSVVVALRPDGAIPPIESGDTVVVIGPDGRVMGVATEGHEAVSSCVGCDPSRSDAPLMVAISDTDVERVVRWGDEVRVGVPADQ